VAQAQVARWQDRLRLAREFGESELFVAARQQLAECLAFLDKLIEGARELQSELASCSAAHEAIQGGIVDLCRPYTPIGRHIATPRLLALPTSPDDEARRHLAVVVERTGRFLQSNQGYSRTRREHAEGLWLDALRRRRES
jgi:hypothetical protein